MAVAMRWLSRMLWSVRWMLGCRMERPKNKKGFTKQLCVFLLAHACAFCGVRMVVASAGSFLHS